MLRPSLVASLLGSLCLAIACSSTSPKPAPASPAPTSPAPSAPTTPEPSAPTADPLPPAATTAPTAQTPEPSVPTTKLASLERSYDKAVWQLELGDPPTAVAMGAAPLLFDGKQWKAIVRPESLAPKTGERDEAFVYFGRDNRPRMMGARLRDGGAEMIYLRYKNGAWRKEPGEIGHLGGHPPGPLYGMLGHADPEVVCKPKVMCIIKRRSGWTMFTPGADRPKRVVLSEGRGWSVYDRRIDRLDDDGWKPVGDPAPFTHAWGVVSAKPALWVSDPGLDALFRYDGSRWTRIPSPIAGPRGMWAAGPKDIWLAGQGGAAHYDGTRWSRVEGVKGPLSAVAGRDATEVWFAGESGVWRGTR